MAAEEPASSPHPAPPERPTTGWFGDAADSAPHVPVFEPIVDLRTVATVGFRASARSRPGAGLPAADPLDAVAFDAWLATALLTAATLPARAWLLVDVPLARLRAGPLAIAAGSRPLVAGLGEPIRAADLAMLRTRSLDSEAPLALAVAAASADARHEAAEVTLGVLRPEYLLLDEDVVDGVHANPARRARLTGALELARQIGASPIAFGVRRAEDERQLAASGVTLVAGRRYGGPTPAGALPYEIGLARPTSTPVGIERGPQRQTPRDDDDVARAIGIGMTLAGALREAGVTTIGELRRLGGLEAWERVRRVKPSVASGATLLQLEGATRDLRLTQLPMADRARLRAEARARLATPGDGPGGGPPAQR